MKNLFFVGISMLAAIVSCGEVSEPQECESGRITDSNEMLRWKIEQMPDTIGIWSENAEVEDGWMYYEDPDGYDWGSKEGYPGDASACDCWFDIPVTSLAENAIEGAKWCLLALNYDGEWDVIDVEF